MSLPTDAKARKAVPLFTGFVRYFPDAMAAVAEVSRIGNEQHNPGEPLHWARGKSQDHGDSLLRHQVDAGKFDSDGVRHSAKVAWRAMAQLQEELEAAAEEPTAGQSIAFKGGRLTGVTGLPFDVVKMPASSGLEDTLAELRKANEVERERRIARELEEAINNNLCPCDICRVARSPNPVSVMENISSRLQKTTDREGVVGFTYENEVERVKRIERGRRQSCPCDYCKAWIEQDNKREQGGLSPAPVVGYTGD